METRTVLAADGCGGTTSPDSGCCNASSRKQWRVRQRRWPRGHKHDHQSVVGPGRFHTHAGHHRPSTTCPAAHASRPGSEHGFVLQIGAQVLDHRDRAMQLPCAALQAVHRMRSGRRRPVLMCWRSIPDDHPLVAGRFRLQAGHRCGNVSRWSAMLFSISATPGQPRAMASAATTSLSAWRQPGATLNKCLAACSASLWALCGVANPRHRWPMAVVCALQRFPNRDTAHPRRFVQRCLRSAACSRLTMASSTLPRRRCHCLSTWPRWLKARVAKPSEFSGRSRWRQPSGRPKSGWPSSSCQWSLRSTWSSPWPGHGVHPGHAG